MSGNTRRRKRWRFFLVLVILVCTGKLIYNGITTVNLDEIDNLNGGKISVIGHGGVGFTSIYPFQPLPSNSASSIIEALELGVDGIEVDLQMTKDSVFVLYHDDRLEESTVATGCISDRTWAEIQGSGYQVGVPFDWFQNEEIITLDSALSLLDARDEFPTLILDYHVLNFCNDDVFVDLPVAKRALQRVLSQHQIPAEKVFLCSMHEVVYRAFAGMEDQIQVMAEGVVDSITGINKLPDLGIVTLDSKMEELNQALVQRMHQDGFKLMIHGGKSRWGLKQRIELNPDMIATDNVQNLMSLLERNQ